MLFFSLVMCVVCVTGDVVHNFLSGDVCCSCHW